MASTSQLRPVERRVLRWAEHGLDDAQVRLLADLDRPASAPRRGDLRLRPLERRLLRWREQGIAHEELSHRFRRSPDFLARVERYAHYKLATP